jgi:hypothetical protein
MAGVITALASSLSATLRMTMAPLARSVKGHAFDLRTHTRPPPADDT